VELTRKLFFSLRPYARTLAEIDAFEELVKDHGEQLHFSGKYAEGRADIFYDQLPPGVVPKKIVANLLEGTEYFQVVKERVKATGSHPYLDDGPELDLGFHLLDIITTASDKFGGVDKVIVNWVTDPAESNPAHFEPGYCFRASLTLTTLQGEAVEILLAAGKYNGPNERNITFEYEGYEFTQQYTVGQATDPVSKTSHNEDGTDTTEVLAEHLPGYNYYATELQPSVFGQQSSKKQQLSLLCMRLAIKLKTERLEKKTIETNL
jgi:hypothetical protein